MIQESAQQESKKNSSEIVSQQADAGKNLSQSSVNNTLGDIPQQNEQPSKIEDQYPEEEEFSPLRGVDDGEPESFQQHHNPVNAPAEEKLQTSNPSFSQQPKEDEDRDNKPILGDYKPDVSQQQQKPDSEKNETSEKSEKAEWSQRYQLFTTKLPMGINSNDLKSYFSKFGDLYETPNIPPHKNYGFVSFFTREDAEKALKGEHYINGAKIMVLRSLNNIRLPGDEKEEDINPSAFSSASDYERHRHRHHRSSSSSFRSNDNPSDDNYNRDYNGRNYSNRNFHNTRYDRRRGD